MVAGYSYTQCGNWDVFKCYKNPPITPIIFALTNAITLDQVALIFPLMSEPTPDSIRHSTGHVIAEKVVAIPETWQFDELDIPARVQEAKVQACVLRNYAVAHGYFYFPLGM
jgi:hypothetical protein